MCNWHSKCPVLCVWKMLMKCYPDIIWLEVGGEMSAGGAVIPDGSRQEGSPATLLSTPWQNKLVAPRVHPLERIGRIVPDVLQWVFLGWIKCQWYACSSVSSCAQKLYAHHRKWHPMDGDCQCGRRDFWHCDFSSSPFSTSLNLGAASRKWQKDHTRWEKYGSH